jgi:hypothetical protein
MISSAVQTNGPTQGHICRSTGRSLHLTLQRAAFLLPARGGGQAGVGLDTKGQVLDAPAARPLLAVPTAGTVPEV